MTMNQPSVTLSEPGLEDPRLSPDIFIPGQVSWSVEDTGVWGRDGKGSVCILSRSSGKFLSLIDSRGE